MSTPSPAPSSPSQGTVLVALADHDARREICAIVESLPAGVARAASSAIAEAQVERRCFDAVICGLDLPDVVGIEVLRRIRNADPDVPVILVSARPSLESAVAAVELGGFRYLILPVTPHGLAPVLREAFETCRRNRKDAEASGRRAHAAGARAVNDAAVHAAFEHVLGGLWVAYQPVVSTAARRVFGFEAFLRSDDPVLPSPISVLRVAEQLGRICDVGRRVRRAAAAGFSDCGGFTLFVNVHPRDLTDPALCEPSDPLVAIAKSVVLEITERAALEAVTDAAGRIADLRGLGFRIAIDDLGAGYATLNSLVEFEPDVVKIDMSLVRDIDQSPTKRRIVRAVVRMARDLGVQVVGEGVETAEECVALADAGCELMQGYLFGRPVRAPTPVVWPAAVA